MCVCMCFKDQSQTAIQELDMNSLFQVIYNFCFRKYQMTTRLTDNLSNTFYSKFTDKKFFCSDELNPLDVINATEAKAFGAYLQSSLKRAILLHHQNIRICFLFYRNSTFCSSQRASSSEARIFTNFSALNAIISTRRFCFKTRF